MMTTALIFAGGTGSRMNSRSKPKQFLELHGKPILIHTLEHFEYSQEINSIAVVCRENWIDYLKEQLRHHFFEKVRWVVPGGETGQQSIFNGLKAIYESCDNPKETIVLIHDGVRPLINEKVISDNIATVKQFGSAITVTKAVETVIRTNDLNEIVDIQDRNLAKIAKAPQSFYLNDIMAVHLKALEDNNVTMVDSASLMLHYGYKLHTVEGPVENIKITTPFDYYIFRAIYEARENSQIFGL
ncbi:2-C-methyl-D-erythritol 4-phosphate cytidylyltransferase [Paenibacillus sp. MDMC362]|uniref:IspD/TarI family cytidylyltransferase n=1 Tax=Paenibacillus sp. MDMC362 TaxID=2977365 RepID=UPI000DC559DF|nr:IspD/TarI family cytidylyltransferase [Paenibacillus sp. MDMC362]RAR42439.1 2-C-methyl-D-erythritol 4-phosphate cytidylyltransferase [Paenibacillus sp. MDMC362]